MIPTTRVLRLALLLLPLLAAACSGDTATEAACGEGQLRCGGECVVPAADPEHCGACDTVCAEDEVCSEGSCATTCAEGLAACGGACIDTATSNDHCGGCGEACGDGTTCSDGACVCPEGLAACGDGCVDTTSSDAHCGGCGLACDEGSTCVEGSCEAPCGEGEIRCEGVCVNPATDDDNCGGCGTICGGALACIDGDCGCAGGLTACGESCRDLQSDAQACGGCDIQCEAGENADGVACVEGGCAQVCAEGWADCDGDPANGCEVELAGDAAHCGACENGCGAEAYCAESICCDAEGLVCDGACIDPLADDAHCGGCGLGCDGWPASSGGTCLEGGCVLACEEGFDDCNGDREDGCEVDLSSDSTSCGSCGKVCGARCGEGACLSVRFPPRMHMHACVLHGDGQVDCWGYNQLGQAGAAPAGQPSLPLPGDVPIAGAVEVATGEMHSCARTTESTVYCWGQNDAGQLGTGTTSMMEAAPQLVMDGDGSLSGVQQIALTASSSCALLQDGTVKCWGSGQHGQLGNGDTEDALQPTFVLDETGSAPLANVSAIAAGMSHACALLQDGTVACWGQNNVGQLGTGDQVGATLPTAVQGLPAAVDQVVATAYRTCARAGGDVHCWGQNNAGQAGIPGPGNVLVPTQVAGLGDAADLHIGPNHSCALLAGGTAACWGMNNEGQLGDGTTTFTHTPVQVLDGSQPWNGLLQIAAGAVHTCVVESDHTVRCFGGNTAGQLGDGTTTSSAGPVDVIW